MAYERSRRKKRREREKTASWTVKEPSPTGGSRGSETGGGMGDVTIAVEGSNRSACGGDKKEITRKAGELYRQTLFGSSAAVNAL